MKDILDEFDNLERILKLISAQFGSGCEVVLHNLNKPNESTIVAIENGHITRRFVGDCSTSLGFEMMRDAQGSEDKYNYFSRQSNGRLLRSSSMFLRDDNGEAIGAICINYDLSEFLQIDNFLKKHTMIGEDKSSHVDEVFVNNVSELLEHFLVECQNLIGKLPEAMTKDDKINAVKFLDSKGAFLITKSGDRVCEFLGISKYTLYSYLDKKD